MSFVLLRMCRGFNFVCDRVLRVISFSYSKKITFAACGFPMFFLFFLMERLNVNQHVGIVSPSNAHDDVHC